MKRTNVVVDAKLLERAKRLTGVRTTRDLLDRALRDLVAREEHRKVAERLRGSGWEGDLAAMRAR